MFYKNNLLKRSDSRPNRLDFQNFCLVCVHTYWTASSVE